MKSRIIPRLQRDLIAEKYRDDADARAARVSLELVRRSVEELRGMGLRRASRTVPEPPYEPFAIALTPEAAAKLAVLPEGVSVSAMVQEMLRH
ncbi:hypothetical protein HF283_00120 [Acidithiobacillus ferrooxidans]|jgi:hypothetical protein|uniref:hypothetical protein n=1 Tax=Acidithiobacillus TaxID=119977 RepID=UPI000AB9A585|nr:hypothetical protein [Acidithiobacillus ferridurans]MBU2805199.1 hypothetical protein [Acidithiobacillus ferridurans]MBU2822527.1 hypothetical protein [Acidithiobacillus ferrooxidans]